MTGDDVVNTANEMLLGMYGCGEAEKLGSDTHHPGAAAKVSPASPDSCPDCGDRIINAGAHSEACTGIRGETRDELAERRQRENERYWRERDNRTWRFRR